MPSPISSNSVKDLSHLTPAEPTTPTTSASSTEMMESQDSQVKLNQGMQQAAQHIDQIIGAVTGQTPPVTPQPSPAACSGKHINKVQEEEMGRAGGDKLKYLGLEVNTLLQANPQIKDPNQKLNAGQDIRLPQEPTETAKGSQPSGKVHPNDYLVVKMEDIAVPKF